MKTTLPFVTLLLVLVFYGQFVSALEEPREATEVDSQTDAADDSRSEEAPVDPERNLAETPEGRIQSSDSYPSSHNPDGSVYGKYNSKECCWERGPRAPGIRVGDRSQSEDIRRKIEYELSKNVAVKQAVSKHAMNCEKSHWSSEGLSDNCPSEYKRATEIRLPGKKCYIVRPNQQCVTYKRCSSRRPCAGRNIIKRPIADRGSLPVLVSRRRVRPKEDPCDRVYMRSSTCLPDGYRTFPVWVYCDYSRFKLINLELPQCCSCKRYQECIPQI